MRILAPALLVVVACDGPAEPPARGAVSVRVLRREAFVANATVVFHGARGAVLGTAVTDALGDALGEIEEGGAVTVIDPDHEQWLTTIMRVELDSALQIPLEGYVPDPPPALTLTVTAPTTADPAETIGYGLWTPCDIGFLESLPSTIGVETRCGPGTPTLLFALLTSALDTPLRKAAWIAARVDADSVVRPAGWSTSCSDVAFDSDVPMSLVLSPRFGGHAFGVEDLDFCAAEHPTLDLGDGVLASMGYVQERGSRWSVVVRDFTTTPSTIQVRATEDLLLGAVSLERSDAEGASWTSDDALAAADAIDVTVDYLLGSDDLVRWRFLLPPDARGVKLLDLPPQLKTWGPIPRAYQPDLQLRYVDASWLDADLAAVHRELPLLLEGVTSQRDIPRGSALREYNTTFDPTPP